MKSSTRLSTEKRLIEYVQLRTLGPLEVASTFDLTSAARYAVDAKLPNMLTTMLRELGRRGGLEVSIQSASPPQRPPVPPRPLRNRV